MKIIVSDFDGTLTNNSNPLTEDILAAIDRVVDTGNIFIVASGREYSDLKRFFRDLKNDIYYISSDGALVMYKEKAIYKNPISKKAIEFVKENFEVVDEHIINDDILKITIKKENPYKLSYIQNNRLLKITYTDDENIEFSDINTDKATAFMALGFNPRNMIAIGDNYNDINLLKIAGESYCVEDSVPDAGRIAKYKAKSAEEVLMKIINGGR